MIQLARPPEPETLARNRAKWTARWIKCLQDQSELDWATKKARKTLQAPLLGLAHGKCAFCEGVLNVTSFIEIEHYHAKTVRQELVFHWSNLFPCCGICNRLKRDFDHQGSLLKPDEENPEPLLWLHPGTGELQPYPSLSPEQAGRVETTIKAYDLQRGALCAQRIEMMNFVNRWLSRVTGGQAETEECRQEWQYMVRPTTPWKFVIRHALTLAGQAQLAEIDRQMFLQKNG